MVGISEIASLVLVGALWGCTNPLLRKGAANIIQQTCSDAAEDSSSSSSSEANQAKKSLIRSVTRSLFKFVHVKVWLPYLLNQAGSVLFYYTLATSDLSLSVPICNSLALVFSIVTSYFIGERIQQPIRTFVGASFVTIGVGICLLAQDGNNNFEGKKESSSPTGKPPLSPKKGVPLRMHNRSYKDPLRELHPSTAVIRAGYRSDFSERAIKPPVFRSSTFEFATAEEGEMYFKRAYHLEGSDGKSPGLVYSRLNNPNTEIFEDKMVALERGSRYASAFPSGMSAISTTIMAVVPAGGHVLHTCPVYGGTYFFLHHTCPDRLSVTTEAVDTSDEQVFRDAVAAAPRLDAIFIETPANPTLTITDIELVGKIAREKNPSCLIIVDNTFMGVFQSPLLLGADIVVYSCTKFIGGHSDLLAGVALTTSWELIQAINGYRTILGPVLSPDNSWLLTRSLETLWLRMERQAEKAAKLASALANHPRVERVYFPGNYASEVTTEARAAKEELFERQCTGPGSMVTFIVKPNTRKAAYAVLNAVNIAHLAVSLGSTETLIQHPRSMTHSDMTVEDLDSCGITEGMVRVSVGLESSKDLIKDMLAALDAIQDEV